MKLGTSNPYSCRSAIHWQSLRPVLRPGTLRMCAALHTGHQYTPVDSIAVSVTPSSASHAAIFCSDRQNVANLQTVTARLPGCRARQPDRYPDDLLRHVDPRDARMDDIHSHLPPRPPKMDTGTPPAEPAARSRSCNTRSQRQSGAPTGQAPASI
jgi:hypothetical protein